MRDGVDRRNRFPSDFDQRHTVNVYGGYRLKPTVNLSVQLQLRQRLPDSRVSAAERHRSTT